MSAPIRPLPIEAAPQRTESDATTSPDQDAPAFGEILHLHLDEEQEESPKEEPAKPAGSTDVALWTFFGILPITPVPSNAPQVVSASGQTATADVAVVESSPSNTSSDVSVASSSPSHALIQALTPSTDGSEKISPLPQDAPEEIAGKEAESSPKLHGIPDAKQLAMQLSAEKKDSPSSTEQRRPFDLPAEPAAIERSLLAARPVVRATENPFEMSVEKLSVQGHTLSPVIRLESTGAPIETRPVADVRAVSVLESVREQVQLLRVAQANELHVVLRPDAHTELFLQIRRVEGQIHLQASCERGDFTWLDSQWTAVQSALGSQGVRVDPLQAPSRGENNTGSTSMQDHGGSRRDQGKPSSIFFYEQEPLTLRKPSRPTGSGPRARGWQSWA